VIEITVNKTFIHVWLQLYLLIITVRDTNTKLIVNQPIFNGRSHLNIHPLKIVTKSSKHDETIGTYLG
jgi:hypothetical protein